MKLAGVLTLEACAMRPRGLHENVPNGQVGYSDAPQSLHDQKLFSGLSHRRRVRMLRCAAADCRCIRRGLVRGDGMCQTPAKAIDVEAQGLQA